MKEFLGRVVWITGASSGIGEEAAIQFSRLGCELIISARNEASLISVAAKCLHPDKVWVLPYDVTRTDDAKEIVARVIAKMGRIDLLLHSAGISQRSYAIESEFIVYRRVMEVNYFGLIALSQAVLPFMVKAGGGQLIAISSVVGKFGFGARSAYSASKHAIHGYMESVYLELNKKGIRTLVVCPGPVKTPISINALDANGKPTGVMDEMQEKGISTEACLKQIIKALKRDRREVVAGGFTEKFGVKLHAWFPRLFLKLAAKQDPQGEIKL